MSLLEESVLESRNFSKDSERGTMGFNEAQAQAIQHTDGPCLVLAGPGSGKTLTIVNRVKYLIEKQKVRPEEILVVTFYQDLQRRR